MKKLDTPLGMLLTVALLVVYTAYAVMTATIERSPPYALAGVLAAVASVGTALLKPWSRFLVYALAVAFVAKLAQSIWAGAAAGYFSMHFATGTEAILSLVPGLLIAILSVVCCFIAHRHFAANRSLSGAKAE